MLTIAHPWLLLTVFLPLLVRWFSVAYTEVRPALQVPFLERLVRLTGRQPAVGAVVPQGSRVQSAVSVLVWIGLVLALARPQWNEDPLVKTVPTRDLLVAVDLSGSMETKDFTDASGTLVDRVTAVKQVLDEFLARREGDRVGLLFFGNAPFVQVPFTDDLDVCRALLGEAQARMAGPQTMMGDAIGLAIHVFECSEMKEKVLILLTDGNDTGSGVEPVQAAEIARDEGITIHTIAMGDPEATGEEQFDEPTLRSIADVTGGRFFRAIVRAELDDVYRTLDAMLKRRSSRLLGRALRGRSCRRSCTRCRRQ